TAAALRCPSVFFLLKGSPLEETTAFACAAVLVDDGADFTATTGAGVEVLAATAGFAEVAAGLAGTTATAGFPVGWTATTAGLAAAFATPAAGLACAAGTATTLTLAGFELLAAGFV